MSMRMFAMKISTLKELGIDVHTCAVCGEPMNYNPYPFNDGYIKARHIFQNKHHGILAIVHKKCKPNVLKALKKYKVIK